MKMDRARTNNVYRKVAIENSYYVEELPDGSRKIIYQPIIYISSSNEKDLTIIEFSKPGSPITDNVSNGAVKDNNNLPNPLAPVEQPLMNADAAAAIANSLPEIIKDIEREDVIKSSIDALSNPHLQTQMTNANQETYEPSRETQVTNFDALSSFESTETQMQTTNAIQDISDLNTEISVTNLDALSNYKILQTQTIDVNNDVSDTNHDVSDASDDVSEQNKENSVDNFDNSKLNDLEPQEDLRLTRSYKSFNNLIQVYCEKCQVVPSNVTDYNCTTCSSLLLFQCINCTQSFETYAQVENHVKFKCRTKPVFNCTKCSYNSYNEYYLSRHMRKHNSSPEKKTLKSTPSKNTLHNKNSKSKKRKISAVKSETECSYCEHEATNGSALALHIFRKHQDHLPETHKCPFCGIKYKRGDSLNRHMTKNHKEKSCSKVYQCDYCSVEFRIKRVLIKHVHEKHVH